MKALIVTNLTFREAWRQKIFWMALVLGAAFLILFGIGFHFQTAIQVGIIASLIMPSEAMWRMVSDMMQPPLIRRLEFPLINLYSRPSSAMIGYAGVYIVVLVALGLRQFSRRDL